MEIPPVKHFTKACDCSVTVKTVKHGVRVKYHVRHFHHVNVTRLLVTDILSVKVKAVHPGDSPLRFALMMSILVIVSHYQQCDIVKF